MKSNSNVALPPEPDRRSQQRLSSPVARLLSVLAAFTMAIAGLGLQATAASATHPGQDGLLTLVRHNQIYTIGADGRGQVKLTNKGKNSHPKWSPDGTRIAYVHETRTGSKDLWVMNANGTVKQQVTTLGTVTTAGSWSPDGENLAFATYTLHTVKATFPFGSPVQMLGYQTNCEGCDPEDRDPTRLISVDRFLAWSTDGASIVVWNHDDAQVDDTVHMYYLATGEIRQIAGTGAECCGNHEWVDFFWGPTNGLGFSFIRQDTEDPEPAPSRIYYSATNASPWPSQVTGGFVSAAGDTGGAPSPSGSYMAFTNASSGVAKVYIANVDGSGRRVLTRGYQPDWQPRP